MKYRYVWAAALAAAMMVAGCKPSADPVTFHAQGQQGQPDQRQAQTARDRHATGSEPLEIRRFQDGSQRIQREVPAVLDERPDADRDREQGPAVSTLRRLVPSASTPIAAPRIPRAVVTRSGGKDGRMRIRN